MLIVLIAMARRMKSLLMPDETNVSEIVGRPKSIRLGADPAVSTRVGAVRGRGPGSGRGRLGVGQVNYYPGEIVSHFLSHQRGSNMLRYGQSSMVKPNQRLFDKEYGGVGA